MRTFKLLAIGYVIAIICAFTPTNLKAQSVSTDTLCAVSNGVARVTPQGMSDVREVTVLRPDGGVVYLYSPRLGVFNLVSPGSGLIEIDPQSQLGSQYAEDGKLHSRKVFSNTGNYRLFVLGKATKAAQNVQYTRIGCSLDFTEDQGFHRVQILNNIAKDSVISEFACPKGEQPALMAACRASSGCQNNGHGYCCTSDGTGNPCFCDNCCVAFTIAAVPLSTSPQSSMP